MDCACVRIDMSRLEELKMKDVRKGRNNKDVPIPIVEQRLVYSNDDAEA